MSRVVLAAADEELILRVKQAADGDVHVLPSGRLPGDPARLFEQLLDGELPDVLVIDVERHAALTGEPLERLHRSGLLRLATLATASLGNIQQLIARKQALLGAAG